jgi:hypothetical protein
MPRRWSRGQPSGINNGRKVSNLCLNQNNLEGEGFLFSLKRQLYRELGWSGFC